MAKSVLAAVLDAALNYIDTNMTGQHVNSAQPTTRTDAATTVMLATVAMAAADGTLAAGDVSGRKISFTAKSAISVSTSGTANHISITSATELLLVTTCTSQAINTGGTVDIPLWKYEINLPT